MASAVPTLRLSSGYDIPIIGLGTFGDSAFETTPEIERKMENALNVALENGYRHFDTAWIYFTEHIIGRILKQWFASGKLTRKDIFITTKLPLEGTNPDRVEKYLKQSLERLELDYVDMYLIHFPIGCKPLRLDSLNDFVTDKEKQQSFEPEPINDHIAIWKKMEHQVHAGRTKSIGLSNFNIKQLERIVKNSTIKPACLQIELHVFLPQRELVKYAQNNGIVVVAYSPLVNPGSGKFFIYKESSVGMNSEPIISIAKKHNKTPAQIMLKFLVQQNIVVIPKSVTASRIKENLNIFDFSLDESDWLKLNNAAIGEPARICNFAFIKSILKNHAEWPFAK